MNDRPLKTVAIKRFLEHETHQDLAALYGPHMEVQVNVGQDGGERIDGEFKGRQWHAFTDGVTTWKPIRIPWNANSNPTWDDSPINFDLVEHVEAIGMTGWDWQSKLSRWVGFDFDAITGHSEKHTHKLTESELKEVEAAACAIDWVTVRRSTSGKGLHLYVFLEPFPTETHTEHQAVARSILSLMSGIVGFDFKSKVDACGGVMWVWHRKMRGTDGLTILKHGGKLYDVPPDWRDHINVVSGKRSKTLPTFVEDSDVPEAERIFAELTGQRNHVILDDDHKRLITWLQENGHTAMWSSDHHMMITHTYALQEAHEALGFKGVFKTNAKGAVQGDHNCFAFPTRRGAWAIRRYTPGITEESSWDQDGSGWTRCYYNREPDLPGACRANGGVEHPSGGFVFRQAESAQKAGLMLGANLNLPPWALIREMKLKEHKDGRLIAELKHDANDPPLEGWIHEGKAWKRVFSIQVSSPTSSEVGNYDDLVRHLVTSQGENYGWVLRTDRQWRTEPLIHVKTGLQYFGLSNQECTSVLGSSIFKPWTMATIPFQPEYPGDRVWNRDAPQFVYPPARDKDILTYPTWARILRHIGRGLDDAIQMDGWAKANGILTGADYLKCWLASLFQEPTQPLPYLFLYSPEQNTGKSTLHEAITLLLTRGVVRADTALISQSGFNGELEKAILCVVEELDLKKSSTAYNRIKDWVTAPSISIHSKGETPYTIQNTTHWIQTANDHNYCPMFPGDTRITMIRVDPLQPEDMVPKKILFPLLQKEASDFIAELLALEIPPSNDRLNVPVITTDEKQTIQLANKTMLELFLDEHCHAVTGCTISVGDFYDRFREWLDPNYIAEWSKIKVGREMPPQFPKGRTRGTAQWAFGNISWEPFRPGDISLPKLIIRDEYLTPVPEAKAL